MRRITEHAGRARVAAVRLTGARAKTRLKDIANMNHWRRNIASSRSLDMNFVLSLIECRLVLDGRGSLLSRGWSLQS